MSPDSLDTVLQLLTQGGGLGITPAEVTVSHLLIFPVALPVHVLESVGQRPWGLTLQTCPDGFQKQKDPPPGRGGV